jgi:hypothetical protein
LRVKVINMTDVIVWEWHRGMAATNTLKTVAAGTTTVDTTLGDRRVRRQPTTATTVTLSAALAASAKASSFSHRLLRAGASAPSSLSCAD